MPTISWLVPTRGRPQLLQRFLTSLSATAADPTQIEVILRVDDDDLSMAHFSSSLPLQIRLITGPSTSMGALNSDCLRAATGDVIILGNDDLIIRSPSWDTAILQASRLYPDGIYLIHVRDGFVNHRHICFPILSKRLCSLMGDPFPSIYQGDHIDTHIEDLFSRLSDLGHHRVLYLDTVFFEHMTHAIGKGAWDTIYAKRNHFRDYLPFLLSGEIRAQTAQMLFNRIETGAPVSLPSPTASGGHLRALLALFQQSFQNSTQTRSYRYCFFKEHAYRYLKLALKTAFPLIVHSARKFFK